MKSELVENRSWDDNHPKTKPKPSRLEIAAMIFSRRITTRTDVGDINMTKEDYAKQSVEWADALIKADNKQGDLK